MKLSGPIRVLVADDSSTALHAVCSYLGCEAIFEIIGTAVDGLQLLLDAQRLVPELVLADLSMPKMSGLVATIELRKLFPQLPIIIFTELSGLSLREECLRCGADGFVYKSELSEKLLDEVHRIFHGRT